MEFPPLQDWVRFDGAGRGGPVPTRNAFALIEPRGTPPLGPSPDSTAGGPANAARSHRSSRKSRLSAQHRHQCTLPIGTCSLLPDFTENNSFSPQTNPCLSISVTSWRPPKSLALYGAWW